MWEFPGTIDYNFDIYQHSLYFLSILLSALKHPMNIQMIMVLLYLSLLSTSDIYCNVLSILNYTSIYLYCHRDLTHLAILNLHMADVYVFINIFHILIYPIITINFTYPYLSDTLRPFCFLYSFSIENFYYYRGIPL